MHDLPSARDVASRASTTTVILGIITLAFTIIAAAVAMSSMISRLDEREINHYAEVALEMSLIRADISDLRQEEVGRRDADVADRAGHR